MKIACNVVTYNRLNLLKACIDGLENQSYKDFDIVVINNDSTDGTQEWLLSKTKIKTINQENLGGAGGFYTGMKYAYDNNYDWIWMMDDDGVTDKDQLKELVEKSVANNLIFTNALVCNIEEPEKLSFGLFYKQTIQNVADAKKYKLIPNSVNPFNGTFINRKVIDQIGFIKKEMYIWGDEWEYTLRAQKNKIVPTTVVTAIHYHPEGRSQMLPLLPFFKRKILIVRKDRIKYSMKNHGYIFSRYYSKWRVVLFGVEHIIYYLLRLRLRELYLFIKYYIDGIRDNY